MIPVLLMPGTFVASEENCGTAVSAVGSVVALSSPRMARSDAAKPCCKHLGPGGAEASSHGWSAAEPVVQVGPTGSRPGRGGRSRKILESDTTIANLPPPLPGRLWVHHPYSMGSAALHPWLRAATPPESCVFVFALIVKDVYSTGPLCHLFVAAGGCAVVQA